MQKHLSKSSSSDHNSEEEEAGDHINLIVPSLKGPEIEPEGIQNFGALYLGNIVAAQTESTLEERNIKAVLSVIDGIPIYDLIKDYEKNSVTHKHIKVNDSFDVDLASYFDEAFLFIEENLQKHNVFVHCFMGVSRNKNP